MSLNTDNSYEVYIDGEQRAKGDLVDDWDMVAPRQIPDASAKKPERIGFSSERYGGPGRQEAGQFGRRACQTSIPDPQAKKPEDWEDETDMGLEAPLIDNPDYRPA